MKKKSQKQMYYSAVENAGRANELFMEIQKGDSPITKEEFAKLVEKRPSLWGRFAGFFK